MHVSGLCLAMGCALLLPLAAPARGQESQATFFDRDDFNTCEAFLLATDTTARAPYLAWADGYLTARAEDGGLRKFYAHDRNEARFLSWLDAFCRARPRESFYGAVEALQQALRSGSLR